MNQCDKTIHETKKDTRPFDVQGGVMTMKSEIGGQPVNVKGDVLCISKGEQSQNMEDR